MATGLVWHERYMWHDTRSGGAFLPEGGYSDAYVPFCGLAVVEELSGGRSGVEDPFLPFLRPAGPTRGRRRPGR